MTATLVLLLAYAPPPEEVNVQVKEVMA